MKDTGLSAPRWAPLAAAAAPPILTFNEPSLEPLSRTDSNNSSAPQPQLFQPPGDMCSPEGQWNCMTTSWQRCASGMWTAAVPCATGTICQPFGLTDFITIEHEPSVDNGDADQGHADNGHASDGRTGTGHDKSGKSNMGLRSSPGMALLVGALVTGISCSFFV
ncbi:hypothetical protein V8C42DRAFT_322085 [Trichoderma barbatum]